MHEIIHNLWHLKDPSLPLNVLMAGVSYCDKNYIIERKNENILSFEYIINGSGTLEINSQIFYPKKNDIYILTKNSVHKYYSDEINPWEKVWIVFDGSFAESLLNQYIPSNTFLIKDCNILAYMNEIVQIASSDSKKYSEITDEISILLHKIVLHIKNHLQHKILSVPEQIKQYIDINIENLININDIAYQLGYSRNYIIKLFRENYGITPYSYFKNKKIELAKQYLLNTSLNINEISAKLNFADQHYFSGCFKKKVGISPSEFKRKNPMHSKIFLIGQNKHN